jgi:hypothetical protein
MKPVSFFLIFVLVLVLVTLKFYDRILPKIASRVGLILVIALFVLGVAFPDALQKFAQVLEVGRGVDLLVYLLVPAVIGTAGLLVIKVRYLENRIVKLTREIAIREIEKES